MLNTDSVRTDLIDAVRDVFAEMAFLDILEYRDLRRVIRAFPAPGLRLKSGVNCPELWFSCFRWNSRKH